MRKGFSTWVLVAALLASPSVFAAPEIAGPQETGIVRQLVSWVTALLPSLSDGFSSAKTSDDGGPYLDPNGGGPYLDPNGDSATTQPEGGGPYLDPNGDSVN